MRESFQDELDDLVDEVLGLGEEVHETLAEMVRAMESDDEEAARQRIGMDHRYKARGQQIEEHCLLLQVRQAPVAKDLRLLYTVLSLTNHMVRSGTLGEHICNGLVETAGHERDKDLEEAIVEMAKTTRNIFRQGLDIFRSRDIDGAKSLQAADDKVDLLYSEALNLIANPSESAVGTPEWRMRAALTVHYLERISDHGVDIGGLTVFLTTGERIEDAMQQYMDRDIRDE